MAQLFWRVGFLVALTLITQTSRAESAPSPTRQDYSARLPQPGNFHVGYESYLIDDAEHTNAVQLKDFRDAPKHRQLITHVWYPASARSAEAHATHEIYYHPESEYAQSYMTAYRQRMIDLIVKQLGQYGIRKDLGPQPASNPEFARQMSRPVPSIPHAPPAEGSFPLIIYNSGADSGFDENAPLFEWLASHGSIVLSMLGDDLEGKLSQSQRSDELIQQDQEKGVAELKKHFSIQDGAPILMGHSIGAQQSLKLALRGGKYSGLILLDTTLEVQAAQGSDATVLKLMAEKGHSLSMPVLAISNLPVTSRVYIFEDPNHKKNAWTELKDKIAIWLGGNFEWDFRIYRQLDRAPRYLLNAGNIEGLAHDDFTWYGLILKSLSGKDWSAPDQVYPLQASVIETFLKSCLAQHCSEKSFMSLEPVKDGFEPQVSFWEASNATAPDKPLL